MYSRTERRSSDPTRAGCRTCGAHGEAEFDGRSRREKEIIPFDATVPHVMIPFGVQLKAACPLKCWQLMDKPTYPAIPRGGSTVLWQLCPHHQNFDVVSMG